MFIGGSLLMISRRSLSCGTLNYSFRGLDPRIHRKQTLSSMLFANFFNNGFFCDGSSGLGPRKEQGD